MLRQSRWILAPVAAVVVLATATYAALGALVYDRASRVSTHCGGRFASNTPASFGTEGVSDAFTASGFDTSGYIMAEYEEVAVPSRTPGITLSGWFVPGMEPANGRALLVVHGYASCKRDPVVLLPAGMLHRSGFAVLLVDLRDHGESSVEDGRWAGGTDEYLDVLGAWDWLVEARGFRPERIGIFGASVGGSAVVIAMGEEPRVAAAWEDSGYADIDVAIREELRYRRYPAWLAPAGILMARVIWGDDLASRSPAKAAARLAGRPLAITHGELDRRVAVHHALDLAAAGWRAGSAIDPWIVGRAEHNQAMFLVTDEYERRLNAFFQESLGVADPIRPPTRVSRGPRRAAV